MAHYAFIDSNNIVVNVISGVDENIIQTDTDGTQVGGTTEAWEHFYESLSWNKGLKCKRTSYNNKIRGNFASVGFIYDEDFDIFVPSRPFPSWKLNYTTFQWEPPVSRPEKIEGHTWKWSEINKEWVSILLSVE